tara:strand:+ start:10220 stop:10534 length:315 start_codon:yes stop_codon:yes gene_type:complete
VNDQQRDTLKQLIKTRIGDIEELLSATTEGSHLDDDSAKLDQKIASAVNSQVTENEKRELTLLNNNLQWVDSEDAGYCQQCACEIPFARLQAVPTTRLCVACAE